MKSAQRFQPKLLAAMLAACAALAGLGAWLTGLNFWILMAILVGAVLVNGLIATWEDKPSKQHEVDKPGK
jgi:fatty acid desaturase